MSTPRTPALPHPSRQQLDELDALLQRMLNLPVTHLEDDGPEVSPPIPPAPAAKPLPRVALEDSQPRSTTFPAPSSIVATRAELPAFVPLPTRSTMAIQPLPTAPLATTSVEFIPANSPETAASLSQTKHTPAEPGSTSPVAVPPAFSLPRRSRWFQVVAIPTRVWIANFEHLGRPGRWLAGPCGRAVAGTVGLILLGGAFVLAGAAWFGWI